MLRLFIVLLKCFLKLEPFIEFFEMKFLKTLWRFWGSFFKALSKDHEKNPASSAENSERYQLALALPACPINIATNS
jgi:hypothetical protein